MSAFDEAYMTRVTRYASQPFWLYEIGHLLLSTRRACGGGHILDFGCSNGDMAAVVAALTSPDHVVGVDVNDHAIDAGKSLHPHIVLKKVGRDTLPFPNASFDVVLSLHTLGHVAAPELTAIELVRVMKIGGRLAMVVPNRRYYQLRDLLGMTPGPPGDDTIKHEWDYTELSDLFWGAGLRVTKSRTFGRALRLFPWVRSRILLEGYRA